MRAGSIIAIVAALAGCSGQKSFRPLQVGDPAPAYSTRGLKGDTLAVRALKGKVVLLNVWATWCVPCEQEMPAIETLHRAFADSGLIIVAVSIDEPGNDATVQRFVESHRLHFTIARDPARRIERVFHTVGVPNTFLIDRNGRIARKWIGPLSLGTSEVPDAIRGALRG